MKRLQTFQNVYVFRQKTFLTYSEYLITDLGSMRNIESQSHSIASLNDLSFHSWRSQAEAHVAYEATVPCVAGISN